MDQDTRNTLQRATQQIRNLLETEFAEQLEGTYDVLSDGTILPDAGAHLDPQDRLVRQKLVDAIGHIKAGGKSAEEAVDEYTREAAFTFLNRFVALRMLEARGLLQECVSKGDQSGGFKEFCGLVPGISALPDDGYRLYLECLCDELTVEIKVLFDRRDPTTLLWPRRTALAEVLEILAQQELETCWDEDETIGWVYQYFNSSEERKKMREESQAPRNSRELAVRNQFFTPRYVVQFLTDNTLGRIWYEMQKGETRLVDECQYLVRRPSEVFLDEGQDPPEEDEDTETDLSQEELLNKTVHIPHRAKKDPRDLKILDPACGSGHFLLYAFDLLVTIYEEAWHDADRPDSEVTGNSLRDDYSELAELHTALPALVLRHNLHGIDIDPRCAQIGVLALWMRAQRAYGDQNIDRDQRPLITRSNIVVAEPMPGEESMLDEFIESELSGTPEKNLLGQLVRRVFEAMKLAGEAGSLLKIEEDIASDIAEAKKLWSAQPKEVQQSLFERDKPQAVQGELAFDVSGITEADFWEHAEQSIYDALKRYSEGSSGGGFHRRLFAEDAANGFAFIALCRNRYEAVLMNPPFGAGSQRAKREFEASYPLTKNDVYAAFVERGISTLHPGGLVGAITSRTGFFLKSLQKWREDILLEGAPPTVFADLGYGVLDAAMVETAAYCLTNHPVHSATPYFRLLQATDKEVALMDLIDKCNQGEVEQNTSLADSSTFGQVPGSPFVYWVSEHIRRMFTDLPPFLSEGRSVRQGLATADDFQFIRCWWEVPHKNVLDASAGPDWQEDLEALQRWCHSRTFEGDRWITTAKGGGSTPFYTDLCLVVNWERDGEQIKNRINPKTMKPFSNVWQLEGTTKQFFYRPGVTWPRRPHLRGGFSIVPAGCAFSENAPTLFCDADDERALCSLLNSDSYISLLHMLMSRGTLGGQTLVYDVGYIRSVPLPALQHEQCERLASLFESGWQHLWHQASRDETSRMFRSPCCGGDADNLTGNSISETIHSISEFAFNAYEISDVDKPQFEGPSVSCFSDDDHNVGDKEKPAADATSFVSYCFGCILGRWDVRCSLETASSVSPPDPFAPLPVTPPGMLQAGSLSETKTPAEYPLAIDWDGVLVDDAGHNCDVVRRLRQAFQIVKPQAGDNAEGEVCSALGVKSVREYVRKPAKGGFWHNHVKRYSKSRRKAPIYWQLATPSASYSIWLYYHRFTKDTFFQVLNEYVKPKLDHERSKLDRLRGEAGAEPTRSQQKDIEDQEKFVTELTSMVEEVERITPLWNPDLNDGVIINFAPLWRLVPQNKSWQKECKKVWNKLVKGDYDWAHLAMHLWPERVVPKCVSDASLAIAHGLEETFWVQDERERFQPREEPEGSWEPVIKKLIDERSRPGVKAALTSLLEAPAPAGGTRSRRRRKATAS